MASKNTQTTVKFAALVPTLTMMTLSQLRALPSALKAEQAEIVDSSIKKIRKSFLSGEEMVMPFSVAKFDGKTYLVSGRHRCHALFCMSLDDQAGVTPSTKLPCLVYECSSSEQVTQIIIRMNESRTMRGVEKSNLLQSARLDFSPTDTEENYKKAIEKSMVSHGNQDALEAVISKLSAAFAKEYERPADTCYKLYVSMLPYTGKGVGKAHLDKITDVSTLMGLADLLDSTFRDVYKSIVDGGLMPSNFAREGKAIMLAHLKPKIATLMALPVLPIKGKLEIIDELDANKAKPSQAKAADNQKPAAKTSAKTSAKSKAKAKDII